MTTYAHLGSFSGLVDMAKAQRPLFPVAPPGEETRKKAWECFGFTAQKDEPADARLERTWRVDGVDGEEISWSVGFGPRTHAWILKPAGAQGPLPGVVALYDHGHYKLSGKQKSPTVLTGRFQRSSVFDRPITAVEPTPMSLLARASSSSRMTSSFGEAGSFPSMK